MGTSAASTRGLGGASEKKIKLGVLFCFSLGLHYLCRMITKPYEIMKKQSIIIACILSVLVLLPACKKVSVDKLKSQAIEAVIAEQKDSGNVLVVDNVTLTPSENAGYKGKLQGHLNDSIEVEYDLVVTDEGDEFDIDWTRVK